MVLTQIMTDAAEAVMMLRLTFGSQSVPNPCVKDTTTSAL
jgi:hypothetical protein